MTSVFLRLASLSLFILMVAASVAAAQTGENVAVVINTASEASQRVGEYYKRSRAIPDRNIIQIKTTTDETIARAAYETEIEGAIADAIRRHNLHDRILYIVLTKGIPLRISGTAGRDGTQSSVDSELTLLYRQLSGARVPLLGRVDNPYFLGTKNIRDAVPFTHRTHDIYLVTRLDGFTVDDVIALIDRGLAPLPEGRIVLDQRGALSGNPLGDRWLSDAHQRLVDLGVSDRVVLEDTTLPAKTLDTVIGYYSWGSNDPELRRRRLGFRFAPGALAASFVSTDARTFKQPASEWQPTNDWTKRSAWFEGSPQSLIGDLIQEGITGVAGHVAEPYLESAVRPEVLFPAYVSGFNLAESFYLAMPDLSWQSVVIGDPLCAMFQSRTFTRAAEDIDPGEHVETELPRYFSERRAAVVQSQLKAPAPAVNLFLKSEARTARGDTAGAREALEAATTLAPDVVLPQLQLALLYEQSKDYARARALYEQILKIQPNHVIALNNLAYGLAVREGKLPEALSLARRAVTLAPANVVVVDTLAWIEHLNGNTREAVRLIRGSVQRNTGNADVHLHAAIIFAAAGDLVQAEKQLALALTLNADLAETDDVRKLQSQLKR